MLNFRLDLRVLQADVPGPIERVPPSAFIGNPRPRGSRVSGDDFLSGCPGPDDAVQEGLPDLSVIDALA